MSILVQNCVRCGQAFLPHVENGHAQTLCPRCLPASAPSGGADGTEQSVPSAPARFAPLSSLPPERRPIDRRQQTASGPASTLLPRQLPGMPDVKLPRPSVDRQLGFNCPACLVILIIKQPAEYDGRAAPCPHCGTVILPPRVAPPTPFTVLSAPKVGIPLAQSQPLPPPRMNPAPLAALPAPQPPAAAPGSEVRKSLLPPARNLAKAAIY